MTSKYSRRNQYLVQALICFCCCKFSQSRKGTYGIRNYDMAVLAANYVTQTKPGFSNHNMALATSNILVD